jgi:hypothetical protein
MKQRKRSPAAAASFLKNVTSLWPALKGSLALVHKPCIRSACLICASGDKHPAHMLSFTQEGRRRCMYVPAALVPVIQRALGNGRKIEALLYQSGPALIREYRKNRSLKPFVEHAPSGSKTTKKKKC